MSKRVVLDMPRLSAALARTMEGEPLPAEETQYLLALIGDSLLQEVRALSTGTEREGP